ncbi:MAG: hypothetical protein V4501_06890 [Pseudomonadota bacterium]
MIDIIYNMPSILLFLLICSISIIFSVFSLITIDKYVPITFRSHENEGLVIVSAIVGIIYAMLVGFTVLYELENYNKADRAEKDEAKIIFAIYRQTGNLPEPGASKIREQIKDYAQVVIRDEWPAMIHGKPIAEVGDNIIKNIYKDIHDFTSLTDNQQKSLDAIAIDNNALFQAHEERTDNQNAALTPNLWLVLMLGSFLTLGINFLIGMELHMHIVCVTVIALMISAVFYLIVTLDQPYRSDFSVSPTTIKTTLKFLNSRDAM